MTYEWTELDPVDQPVDPLADFALNVMERFTAADLGLSSADTPDESRSKFDEQWWLALVTVGKNTANKSLNWTIEELVEKAASYSPAPIETFLKIPREYGEAQRTRTDLDVLTVYAQRGYLNAANAQDGEEDLGIGSIMVSVPLDSATLNRSSDASEPLNMNLPITPETVVTAVIDHGIGIAHDLFRRENGTGALKLSRVDFYLDMDGTPDPQAAVQSTVGRVWTRTEIEEVLDDNLHNGLLDEAAVYQELGLIDWKTRPFNACAHRVSHGTHVTGLAAGYSTADSPGTDRPIIAVQLPTRLVASTLGQWVVLALEQAFIFIAARMAEYKAANNGQDVPLVMNFSFGNYSGPHDGSGIIDRAIDTALTNFAANPPCPRLLTLPSSNGHLSRCHAEFNLTNTAATEELDWMLQPADRSASILNVWLPKLTQVANGTVELEVKVPGFAISHKLTAGMVPKFTVLTDTDTQGNDIILAVVFYLPPRAPTLRGQFGIYVVPTDHPANVRPVAPSGAWTLTFTKSPAIDELALNIWVQRDETLPGFPAFARQSYLSDPRYTRFQHPGGGVTVEDPAGHESPIRRSGMINGIACGNLPAVIAGYVRSDCRMADYSAGGPTLNPFRLTGPDAAAVSDDSGVLRGVLSAGSSSGSRVIMNGTSVAAPQVARWATDRIALSPTTPFTRASVVIEALTDDPPSQTKPSALRTGGGRMKLGTAFGQLRWSGQ